MAVAISPEDSGFFGPSSPLRRSSSQPRFPMQQGGFCKSASTSRLHDTYKPIYNHHPLQQNHSPHSSPPYTPQTLATESTDLSFASTPASTVSDSDETINLDSLDFHSNLHFPQYDLGINHHTHEELEPPASPTTGDSYTVSSNELESSTVSSTPESPDVVPKGFDDIAIQPTPSHHVDYLSYNWREEDIWTSWKYVISNRTDYTNSERLENASWRTWMKSKNKLKTVSPETLNWSKDCDVTWLYGPLQQGQAASPTTGAPSGTMSQSACFVDKKPILKKRSMSEVMLQQSLSAASLLKQATAAVQAQQNMATRRPILSRAHTDFPSFQLAPMSRDNSLAPSSDTSGVTSPSTERKRIHFNEQVEQCIAVDVKGEDDDGYDSCMPVYDDGDSDSDEGIIMKAVSRKKLHPKPKKSSLKKSKPVETKTIASLPSTTLKYRDDSPEPRETAMKHSYRSPVMSPSSSQETLKPSKKSNKFYMDSDSDSDQEAEEEEVEEVEEENGDDDDEDEAQTPRLGSPSPTKSPLKLNFRLRGGAEAPTSRKTAKLPTGEPIGESTGAGPSDDQLSGSGLRRSVSTNTLDAEGSGMRRTSSGMFMPIEEARDIAHVIWNVGWRR